MTGAWGFQGWTCSRQFATWPNAGARMTYCKWAQIAAATVVFLGAQIAPQTIEAADIPLKAAPPPPAVAPGWFGFIEGRYLIAPNEGVIHNSSGGHDPIVKLGEGWGGALRFGYRFASNWDVAVGASHADYKAGKPAPTGCCQSQRTDAKLTTVDGQLGYTLFGAPGQTGRFFAGVRFLEWKALLNDPSNRYQWNDRNRAVGPVVGFDATTPLIGSLVAIGGFDASVLAGEVRDVVAGPTFAGNREQHPLTYQFGGYIGLGYAFSPAANLTAGYRLNMWRSIESFAPLLTNAAGVVLAAGGGHASHLDHGPFVRLSFDLGAR